MIEAVKSKLTGVASANNLHFDRLSNIILSFIGKAIVVAGSLPTHRDIDVFTKYQAF